MEAGGLGVNSPEFLQKKIERLKTALEEANVLMDRQVTERDEARAQLETVRRENQEIQRQLNELQEQGVAPAPAAETSGLDPELEQSLRDRIAELERERESLQSASQPDPDEGLRERVDALQRELDATRAEA